MSILPQDRIHGACLSEVIVQLSERNPRLHFRVSRGKDQSAYVVQGVEGGTSKQVSFALYIKYSRKRRSPWDYSYEMRHQEELRALKESQGEVFSVFINGDDGYTCVNFADLRRVLDDEFDEVEWVKISRKLNSSYRISGKDGAHEKAVPQSSFPKVISEYVSALTGGLER